MYHYFKDSTIINGTKYHSMVMKNNVSVTIRTVLLSQNKTCNKVERSFKYQQNKEAIQRVLFTKRLKHSFNRIVNILSANRS